MNRCAQTNTNYQPLSNSNNTCELEKCRVPFRVEREACCAPANETNTEFYYENYDGHANNLLNFTWGERNTPLLRRSPYDDTRLGTAPNPRTISNAVCRTTVSIPNEQRLSDLMWAFGQVVDHEVDLTPNGDEDASFTAPGDDPVAPGATIDFKRSIYTLVDNQREQTNTISAYVDATNVYGYSAARASLLRLNDGSGKMKSQLAVNDEVILPNNDTIGIEMAHLPNQTSAEMLAAGDKRANENILLTAMHVLLMREHNRLCDEYVASHPQWLGNDDKIYHEARKRLIGMQQSITFNEFVPLLVGPLPRYTGYKINTNASINNEFSTVAYRVGHSMLSSTLKVLNGSDVLLRDAFFTPDYIRTNGVDALIGGAMNNIMQRVDTYVVEDVRSFLFGPPTMQSMLDLAALNIQRGRDHALPDYNTCRQAYGLARKTSFASITSDTTIQDALASVYSSVDDVDAWVGGLAEDHVAGSQVGEFFRTVLRDQFARLRDGDRFYFENDPTLSTSDKAFIRGMKLSDLLKRNTSLVNVRDNVFVVPL